MVKRRNIGAAKRGSTDPMYSALADMNKDELEQAARDMGIPNPHEMQKEELIAAIRLHSA